EASAEEPPGEAPGVSAYGIASHHGIAPCHGQRDHIVCLRHPAAAHNQLLRKKNGPQKKGSAYRGSLSSVSCACCNACARDTPGVRRRWYKARIKTAVASSATRHKVAIALRVPAWIATPANPKAAWSSPCAVSQALSVRSSTGCSRKRRRSR